MDVYVARQPIFNRRMRVEGYELLYRQSSQNYFSGLDDDRATAELIYNSFLVLDLNTLTDGTQGFINFSKRAIEKRLPEMLPAKSVVIEVLERGKATEETVEACRELRAAGYTIALDDFVIDESNLPLLDVADIVKVEFPAVSHERQRELIKKYRRDRRGVKFLAEKIETREEYTKALKMGYDLFQGYFFSKPVVVSAKEIHTLPTNICFILGELSRPEPNYKTIASVIERDLGLSYKFLKMVNTVYFESRQRITTITRALVHIGLREFQQWVPILMIKDFRSPENAEAVKLSIVRGKLMDLIALELNFEEDASDYFFTGLFSFIDTLMHQPMEQILSGLPLSDGVKEALLGKKNRYRECLDYVSSCERAAWGEDTSVFSQLEADRFMELYCDALSWARQLSY